MLDRQWEQGRQIDCERASEQARVEARLVMFMFPIALSYLGNIFVWNVGEIHFLRRISATSGNVGYNKILGLNRMKQHMNKFKK